MKKSMKLFIAAVYLAFSTTASAEIKVTIGQANSLNSTFSASKKISQKEALLVGAGGAVGGAAYAALGMGVIGALVGGSRRGGFLDIIREIPRDKKAMKGMGLSALAGGGILYTASIVDQKMGKGAAGYWSGVGTSAALGAAAFPLMVKMSGGTSLGFASVAGAAGGLLVSMPVLGLARFFNNYTITSPIKSK